MRIYGTCLKKLVNWRPLVSGVPSRCTEYCWNNVGNIIKTRTGPPLPLQGPGLVSVWPVTTAVASELRDGTCHCSHCMQGYCSAAVPQINIINSDSDYHIFKTKYPSRSQQWSDAGSDGPCPGAWQNKLIYHRNFRILSISLRSKRLPCRG